VQDLKRKLSQVKLKSANSLTLLEQQSHYAPKTSDTHA